VSFKFPISGGHCIGLDDPDVAALFAEAEAVYREDLRRNRDNGWSLTGLQLALQNQERETEAEELTLRLVSAFNDADTRPSSSCYCEP